MYQLQQIIKTEIIWSGCGTYSYVNPLRINAYLGTVKVNCLVDTGSDYDVIDTAFSEVQVAAGNPSFQMMKPIEPRTAAGFTRTMSSTTRRKSARLRLGNSLKTSATAELSPFICLNKRQSQRSKRRGSLLRSWWESPIPRTYFARRKMLWSLYARKEMATFARFPRK